MGHAPKSTLLLAGCAALVPLIGLVTLPQTLVGLALAGFRRFQGYAWEGYRFGPFLFLVVHAPGPRSAGISLGLVVLASSPLLLKHEFWPRLWGRGLSSSTPP